jgi:hypothetical protein
MVVHPIVSKKCITSWLKKAKSNSFSIHERGPLPTKTMFE